MRIMGIDSSSQKTGVALYDGKLRHYELIDYSHVRDYDTRFDSMVADIQKIIERKQPDVVYAEDTWESKGGKFNNTATLKKLSYIVGAIRCICLQKDIPFNLIYPSEWRKTVGISIANNKRGKLKELSIDYVAENYGAEVNDDVADAICIAEAGYIINNDLFE